MFSFLKNGLAPVQAAEQAAALLEERVTECLSRAEAFRVLQDTIQSVTPAYSSVLQRIKHAVQQFQDCKMYEAKKTLLQEVDDKLYPVLTLAPKAAAAKASAFVASRNMYFLDPAEKRVLHASNELDAPEIQQTITNTNNCVVVSSEKRFVFKVQPAILERIASTVCELLGAPHAIVASKERTYPGVLKRFYGKETSIHSFPNGIVKPFVENAVLASQFIEHDIFDRDILPVLDDKDAQLKIAIQALLGAWDLGFQNMFLQIQANEAFRACEKSQWEYYCQGRNSWCSCSLKELYFMTVNPQFSYENVRRSGPLYDLHARELLIQACSSPIKLVFFDNERVMGSERWPQLGNPNDFARWKTNAALPVRCALLGSRLAQEPLAENIIKQIIAWADRRELISQALECRDSLLFQKLSLPLQTELRVIFKGDRFYFTAKMAEGNDVNNFHDMLPQVTIEKLILELQAVAKLPQEPSIFNELIRKDKQNVLDELKLLMVNCQITATEWMDQCNRVVEHLENFCNPLHSLFAQPDPVMTEVIKFIERYNAYQATECPTGAESFKIVWNTFANHFRQHRVELSSYSQRLRATLTRLLPVAAPLHTKALLDRVKNSRDYIQQSCSDFKRMSQKQFSVEVSSTEEIVDTIEELIELLFEIDQVPLHCFKELQSKADSYLELLTEEHISRDSISVELEEEIQQFIQTLTEFLQPTLYGLFCAMYPHLNFMYDIATKIAFHEEQKIDPSFEEIDQKWRHIVMEKVWWKTGAEKAAHLIELSCKEMMEYAVEKELVPEDDPRLQAAKKAVEQITML